MRKMNHFKLLAVICAMTLFASCNFEEINTNQFEMSDGEGAMDGFEVGGLITAMQRTVIPVGTQADDTDVINEYQIAYHLSADFLARTTVTVGTQVVTILLIICWTIG